MNSALEDAKRRRFRWGLLFAWGPPIFLLLPALVNFLRTISNQKATGMGAVAGGLGEAFVNFGVIVALAFEVTAFVLLIRTFPRVRFARRLLSLLSLGCSAFTIFSVGIFVWYIPSYPRR